MKDTSTSDLGTRTVVSYYNDGTVLTSEDTLTKSTTSVVGGTVRSGNFKSPLPWSYRTSKVTYLHGRTTRDSTNPRRHVSGVLASSAGVTSALLEKAIGEANQIAQENWVNNLYDSIRGQDSSDLASSAVEAQVQRTTTNVHRLQKLADEASANADRNFARANGARVGGRVMYSKRPIDRSPATRQIAQSWLSMKFRWMPIVNDIYNIVREATGTMTRKGFVITAYGSGSSSVDPFTLLVDGQSYGRVTPRSQVSVTCRGKFRFVVNTAGDMLARLTSLDPAVIAWNAVPYSFVVDWVFDVGGYLRDLETRAMYASAFKGGYVSTRTRLSAGVSYSGKSTAGNIYIHCNSDVTYKRMSRAVYATLPRPESPKLNLGLSSHQLFNAAALLRVKLKP